MYICSILMNVFTRHHIACLLLQYLFTNNLTRLHIVCLPVQYIFMNNLTHPHVAYFSGMFFLINNYTRLRIACLSVQYRYLFMHSFIMLSYRLPACIVLFQSLKHSMLSHFLSTTCLFYAVLFLPHAISSHSFMLRAEAWLFRAFPYCIPQPDCLLPS
jgi:hypothetical protein